MSNKLADETSPYLLQHADNPVEWYPWGDESLNKAKTEDKPIFLSIGYSACHWCHVMAHESFEDPETAEIMNKYFVNIKVDREERPDLDSVYMNAVVAMTGNGGWPMSVFLSPDGSPFYGGTYFPPVRRYNRPSFKEILVAIANLWERDRSELLKSAASIKKYLLELNIKDDPRDQLDPNTIVVAQSRLIETYDWQYGGWGQAPKFPQPMAIEFFLQKASTGDQRALEVALHALDRMAKGGIYDVIGGGFSRYSTDNLWLVPHFEKMLYDNAQLALVYLYAYKVTNDARYRRICEATLDFILRELSITLTENDLTQIGFFSSLDADSEGEEGKYYLWTPDEIRVILTDQQEQSFLFDAYSITPDGNFEGRNILQRSLDDEILSKRYGIPIHQIPYSLEKLHKLLFRERQKRIHPGVDDKVITAWNALALIAFAEAGRYLSRNDYIRVARANAEFLLRHLYSKGRLQRSWRAGQAKLNAYLEDYAGLALALLYLYQADPGSHYSYEKSTELAEIIMVYFHDDLWGFFDTSDDNELLLTRPKDIQDNATPCGNSLAALALLRLAGYSGDGKWRLIVEKMMMGVQDMVLRYPTGFSKWLCAFDLLFQSFSEIAIIGESTDPQRRALIDKLNQRYRPYTILAVSSPHPEPSMPKLLLNRPLLSGKSTAYVCQNFICKRPVNTPDELESLL